MKIGLNFGVHDDASENVSEARQIERIIANAKKGDWEARDLLTQRFRPLLTTLAEKRSSDIVQVNRYVEAGTAGLLTAMRKYKPSASSNFRIFAIDFIQAAMDRSDRKGGLLSWLFR